MMTGHGIGAALGVAGRTATTGDPATSAGPIDGCGRPLQPPQACSPSSCH
jgi:hypothetical protein